MNIRQLTRDDVLDVADLEASITAFPWPASQFYQALDQQNLALVLVDDGDCQGFAIFSQVLDELTLLNIGVGRQKQGQGWGRKLLLSGLERSIQRDARVCYLEVRQSNQAAIGLYRSLGFSVTGIRKNYYPADSGREDAFLMSRDLPITALGDG